MKVAKDGVDGFRFFFFFLFLFLFFSFLFFSFLFFLFFLFIPLPSSKIGKKGLKSLLLIHPVVISKKKVFSRRWSKVLLSFLF